MGANHNVKYQVSVMKGSQYIEQKIWIFDPCDLDLWPTDPIINKDLLLIGIKHHVKRQVSVLYGSQNIEQNDFTYFTPVTFTYWPK